MRLESEIQDHIRHLLTLEFERRVEEASSKLPQRCVYNHRHQLDSRKQVEGEVNEAYNKLISPELPTIGLCMYGAANPEEWPGNICEDPIDAQRCPLFTPKETPDMIRAQLEGQIRDIRWVQENLPDVHALLWVIDSDKLPDTTVSSQEVVYTLPRWKLFLCRLLGIKTSPVLLPPGR